MTAADGLTRAMTEIDVLLIKQDIRDALSRYCRAMDRRDEPLAASVWHVEGTADYGDVFRGTGAEFATWVTEVHGGFDRHSHQITNVLVEVGSTGDEAVSEAYVTVVLFTAPDADGGVTQISSRGRYLDKWERRGRWGVVHRHYLEDFTTAQQLTAAEVAPASTESRRDHDDPSYFLFAKLR
jgi:hypothetical protein